MPPGPRPLRVFLLGCLVGAAALGGWLRVGEPWEILADGEHYAAMYRGEPVEAPFAYRVFVPWIARHLPWSLTASFWVVTGASLILATGLLALHARRSPQRGTWPLVCAFWAVSFTFAYQATTGVRVDAAMLLLLIAAYALAAARAPVLLVGAVVAGGTLVHEMILVALPVLILDRGCGGTLAGGRHYGWRAIALLAAVALGVLLLVHRLVDALSPADLSYATNSPMAMLAHVLTYSGGVIKHGLRIYAAHGPALLFACAWLATRGTRGEALAFAGLFAVALTATFLATDTLRVMAVISVPVVTYAAAFVTAAWREGRGLLAVAACAIHLAYAWVVYAHLRTFETSSLLNGVAIGLSLAAVCLCLPALRARFTGQASPWPAPTQAT